MPRWTRTLATTAATTAVAGLVVLGGAGVASADPTPGYPGGYPGGYTGGGTSCGGISTTNPSPGGAVTVNACCASSGSATLTFDGTTIATAPVTGGRATLTGNVPAGATGNHTVVATCSTGEKSSFEVTVSSGSGASGSLASTGAKVVTVTVGGVVLLVAGVGIVLLARRRRTTA